MSHVEYLEWQMNVFRNILIPLAMLRKVVDVLWTRIANGVLFLPTLSLLNHYIIFISTHVIGASGSEPTSIEVVNWSGHASSSDLNMSMWRMVVTSPLDL
jgi:hypothetical protein